MRIDSRDTGVQDRLRTDPRVYRGFAITYCSVGAGGGARAAIVDRERVNPGAWHAWRWHWLQPWHVRAIQRCLKGCLGALDLLESTVDDAGRCIGLYVSLCSLFFSPLPLPTFDTELTRSFLFSGVIPKANAGGGVGSVNRKPRGIIPFHPLLKFSDEVSPARD